MRRDGFFALFRVFFGFLFRNETRKYLGALVPLARAAILERARSELTNAEKKATVYAALRQYAGHVFGEGVVSEHILDLVFGSAFGNLRAEKKI